MQLVLLTSFVFREAALHVRKSIDAQLVPIWIFEHLDKPGFDESVKARGLLVIERYGIQDTLQLVTNFLLFVDAG